MDLTMVWRGKREAVVQVPAGTPDAPIQDEMDRLQPSGTRASWFCPVPCGCGPPPLIVPDPRPPCPDRPGYVFVTLRLDP